MKIFLILAIALGTGALSGCVVHGHGVHDDGVSATVHTHTADCGHYSNKGKWQYSEGHRHANGCGHHYDGGIWIVLN